MAKLVVYVAGGAMTGVYSAGVLDALAELGVRDKVDAIYGISAGAFNAANFATNDTRRSILWYAEQVPKQDVIKSKNPLVVLRGKEMLDAVKAARVVEQEHLMDPAGLVHCATPVYFGVVDLDSKEFVWKDARRPDAIKLLQATTTIIPLSKNPVKLDGHRYVDGGFVESVCLGNLRARHPGARLIIILNRRFDEYSIKRTAAHLLIRWHDAELGKLLMKSYEHSIAELKEALVAPDVLLIRPKKDFPVELLTTDAEVVRRGFKFGVDDVAERAHEIMAFVNDTAHVKSKSVSHRATKKITKNSITKKKIVQKKKKLKKK